MSRAGDFGEIFKPVSVPKGSTALDLAIGTGLPEGDVIPLLRRTRLHVLTPAHGAVGGGGARGGPRVQGPLLQLRDRADAGPDLLGNAEVIRLNIVHRDDPFLLFRIKDGSLSDCWLSCRCCWILTLNDRDIILTGNRTLTSCHLELLSVRTDSYRLWNGEVLRSLCNDINKILRNCFDVNRARPFLESAAELTHATREANKPGLWHGDLAVLVRTGTAAGLGVHTPHQGLDLLDVEALGDREACEVQAMTEAEETKKPEVSHVRALTLNCWYRVLTRMVWDR